MKSAYELAMERFREDEPHKPLSEDQKQALAEIDIRYKAKIAEREVFLNKQLQDAIASGRADEAEQIRVQLTRERTRLEEERESDKNKIRNAS